MDCLAITTVISVILSKTVIILSSSVTWAILFSSMIFLLLPGVDTPARIIISSTALYLFFADLTRLVPNISSITATFLGVYIGFYVMIRKGFRFELIPNCLALATMIKLLYIYYPKIMKFLPPEKIQIYILIIVILLIIPIIEDVGRLIIALLSTLGVLCSLSKITSFFNFILILSAIGIYWALVLRIRMRRISP